MDIKSTSCETEMTPESFAQSVIQNGLQSPKKPKSRITLRLDEEVIEWYKKNQGKGYQTYINDLLKAYKEAHQKAPEVA